jgi:hypothetical protein
MTVVGWQPQRTVSHYRNRSTFIHTCVYVCVSVRKYLKPDRPSSDHSAFCNQSGQNVCVYVCDREDVCCSPSVITVVSTEHGLSPRRTIKTDSILIM